MLLWAVSYVRPLPLVSTWTELLLYQPALIGRSHIHGVQKLCFRTPENLKSKSYQFNFVKLLYRSTNRAKIPRNGNIGLLNFKPRSKRRRQH